MNHTDRMSRILDRPICPVCSGRGLLDGVDLNDGLAFDCEACDGEGFLKECAECFAPFSRGSEVHEPRTGFFICSRCEREATEPPPPPPDTDRELPLDPDDAPLRRVLHRRDGRDELACGHSREVPRHPSNGVPAKFFPYQPCALCMLPSAPAENDQTKERGARA